MNLVLIVKETPDSTQLSLLKREGNSTTDAHTSLFTVIQINLFIFLYLSLFSISSANCFGLNFPLTKLFTDTTAERGGSVSDCTETRRHPSERCHQTSRL